MNAKRIAAIFAILVVLGAIWFERKVARSIAEAKDTRSSLARENAALTAKLRDLERARLAAEKSRAERAKRAASAPVSKAAPPPASAGPSSLAEFDQMMKDPKLQLLQIAAKRAELATTYGPFFRRTGLTADQIEKLSDALSRQQTHLLDLEAVSRERKLNPTDSAVVAQRDEALAGLRQAEAAILGADDYQRLQDYERTAPLRPYVSSLAGTAALAGIPLNPEQAERLTQALANATPDYASGGNADPWRIDWDRAETEMSAMLSPEQMILLKRFDPFRVSMPNRRVPPPGTAAMIGAWGKFRASAQTRSGTPPDR